MHWIGMDIGSQSVKMVVLDEMRQEVLSRVAPAGHASLQVARSLLGTIPAKEYRIVVTGYGRVTFPDAHEEISEITCHARGACHIFPDAATVIDVGGQDSKVMHVGQKGKVLEFAMNDRCAAGTGRFLDVMAAVLGVRVEDLDLIGRQGTQAIKLSSTCTVFAESEVVGHLTAGRAREDIAAGLAEAIASRIAGLVRQVGIRQRVVMTGGVANNDLVAQRLGSWLDCPVAVPARPQMVGALGAALLASERADGAFA